jgi:hypothetical protein
MTTGTVCPRSNSATSVFIENIPRPKTTFNTILLHQDPYKTREMRETFLHFKTRYSPLGTGNVMIEKVSFIGNVFRLYIKF